MLSEKLVSTGGQSADSYFATTINYLDRQSFVTYLERPYCTWISLDRFGLWRYHFHLLLVYAFSMFCREIPTGLIRRKGFYMPFFLERWSIAACYCGIATAGVLKGTWFVGFETAKENLKTVTDISKWSIPVWHFSSWHVLYFSPLVKLVIFLPPLKPTAEYFPKKTVALPPCLIPVPSIGAMRHDYLILPEAMGWEMTFIIIGASGFLWMFFWQTMYKKPHLHPKVSKEELVYIQQDDNNTVCWKRIGSKEKCRYCRPFKYNQTWSGFAVGKFMTDGGGGFFLDTGLFKDVYGLSGIQAAPYLTVLYAITMLSLDWRMAANLFHH